MHSVLYRWDRLRNLNHITIWLKFLASILMDKAKLCPNLWRRMSKRAIILFSLVGVLIVSTAGYLGFPHPRRRKLPQHPKPFPSQNVMWSKLLPHPEILSM